MRRTRRAAILWVLTAAGLALYAIALFHPLVAHLWKGGAPAWIEGDVPEEYWPDLVMLCRGLAHGHVPLWNPYEHGGAPFYADPQAGAYYPVNWAICALAGPDPGLGWAEARTVFHFYVASLFMAAFLRGERLGLPASLVGAALFPLSPFFTHNWELNLTSGFAYLPLLLLLSRALARRPTAGRGAALGVGIALTALAGSPPALFYAGLVTIPFAICALRGSLSRGAPPRRLLVALSVAGAVAAALALPMLAPARELAALSVRAHPSHATIAEGALDPHALLGIVLPGISEHTFVGVAALLLVPLGLRRPGAAPLAAVGIVGLLLMLGDHTPLFRVAVAVVPGAAQFRDPARYSALWGTSVVILAAFGMDVVYRRGRSARARSAARLVAGALGVACCVELLQSLPPRRHTRDGPFPDKHATLAALRGVAGGALSSYGVYDEFGIHMRSGSRLELFEFRGYQDPLSLGRYRKVIDELWRSPLLLASFNVRWVLWGPHYLYGDAHHSLANPRGASWATLWSASEDVYEIPSALPAAYWMDGAEVVPDADDALERVRTRAPAPLVVLEARDGGDVAMTPGTGAYSPVSVERETEAITVHLSVPAPGFVVVNEAYFPGWEATLDGRPSPLRRANSLVMATPVPAGDHTLALAFRPWEARVFPPIAAMTLLGVGAMGAVAVRRRCRKLGRLRDVTRASGRGSRGRDSPRS